MRGSTIPSHIANMKMHADWLETVNVHTSDLSQSLLEAGELFCKYSHKENTLHICCEFWRKKLLEAGVSNMLKSRVFGQTMGTYILSGDFLGMSHSKFGSNNNRNRMLTFKFKKVEILRRENIVDLLKLGKKNPEISPTVSMTTSYQDKVNF